MGDPLPEHHPRRASGERWARHRGALGLREATGTYYKVVDSDDWLDASALATMLSILRGFEERGMEIDLFISNYV